MTATLEVGSITDVAGVRVDRGAELLDERLDFPWRRFVVHPLDLSSPFACVLGQLFGHYTDGLRELELGDITARWFGFLGEDSRELEDAWRQAISLECSDPGSATAPLPR